MSVTTHNKNLRKRLDRKRQSRQRKIKNEVRMARWKSLAFSEDDKSDLDKKGSTSFWRSVINGIYPNRSLWSVIIP